MRIRKILIYCVKLDHVLYSISYGITKILTIMLPYYYCLLSLLMAGVSLL